MEHLSCRQTEVLRGQANDVCVGSEFIRRNNRCTKGLTLLMDNQQPIMGSGVTGNKLVSDNINSVHTR